MARTIILSRMNKTSC